MCKPNMRWFSIFKSRKVALRLPHNVKLNTFLLPASMKPGNWVRAFNTSSSGILRNKLGVHSLQNISIEDTRIQKYLTALHREFLDITGRNCDQRSSSVTKKSVNLELLVSLKSEVEKCQQELEEINSIMTEFEKDEELVKSALKEKEACVAKIEKYKSSILNLLIPVEYDDDKDVIMELTAGVGGQEAMLFTKDLFDMYCHYSAFRRWESKVIKHDVTGIGGLRVAHLAISGPDAYRKLKFEGGVHRVQRIPKTEKAGRIHTSTVTVAVLPQPSEIDIQLNPKDIKTEFKNSSGAGGQNVNRNLSCVRLTHLPTGLIVECQEERFQHINHEIALKSLKAKLYQMELEKFSKEQATSRRIMVGSAARSEKIRTYNYPQDRITDHRVGSTVYNVNLFLQGEDKLDNMLQSLQDAFAFQRLHEILEKYNE